MRSRLCLAAAALLLAGCMTAPTSISLSDGVDDKKTVVRALPIDPVMFAGALWTENLSHGNFVAVLGTFPQTAQSWAEWDAFRVRYQAHAVAGDGTEYAAQALFAGFIVCAPRLFILVEGLQGPQAGVKVVTLSTLVDRAYTARGEEIPGFEPGKFQSSAAYRREFILAHGTSLTDMRPIPDMAQAFAGWHVYRTKTEPIATPLSPEQVKHLSGINSQYQYWDKVKGTMQGTVVLDYVGTAILLGFDLINATGAKSQGFDYQSVIGRGQQGYNLAVLEALRAKGERSCLAAMATERKR